MRGCIEALLRLPVLERGEEEGAVGGGAGTQADMQALARKNGEERARRYGLIRDPDYSSGDSSSPDS